MGLLDDAIREHLDLKRRRGADPAEVERAEREALGPVRRGPEEQEQGDAGVDPPLAYDHEGDQDWAEPFDEPANHAAPPRGDEPEPFLPEPPAAERPRIAEPPPPERPRIAEPPPAAAPPPRSAQLGSADLPDSGEPIDPDDPFADPPAGRTPAPHPAPASEPHGDDYAGGETVEYEVEAALEQEGKDEDVLEETPEFLQDTPDHDRLWFEQRPPRDFDFDG